MIERFITDFCSLQVRLIIEVDGPIHQYQQEQDAIRQRCLEEAGITVLRFTNLEVFNNIDGVLAVIERAVSERLPSSPH